MKVLSNLSGVKMKFCVTSGTKLIKIYKPMSCERGKNSRETIIKRTRIIAHDDIAKHRPQTSI